MQRLGASGGAFAREAEFGEHGGGGQRVVVGVLDDEHGAVGHSGIDCRGGQGGGADSQRQAQVEPGPEARLAAHTDRAVHQARQQPARGEPEAGARDLAGVRTGQPREFGEEDFLSGGINARTLVGNGEFDFSGSAGRAGGGEDNAAAGIFQRVGNVVDEDLLDAAGVPDAGRGQLRIGLDDEGGTAGDRLGAESGGDRAQQIGGREWDRPQFDSTGLDAGEVEDIVDERGEIGGAFAQGGDEFALLFVERRVLEREGEAEDAVEGIADVVAHVGDELGLGGAGFHEFDRAGEDFLLELGVAAAERAHPPAVESVGGGADGEQPGDESDRGAPPGRSDFELKSSVVARHTGLGDRAHAESVAAVAQRGEFASLARICGHPVRIDAVELSFQPQRGSAGEIGLGEHKGNRRSGVGQRTRDGLPRAAAILAHERAKHRSLRLGRDGAIVHDMAQYAGRAANPERGFARGIFLGENAGGDADVPELLCRVGLPDRVVTRDLDAGEAGWARLGSRMHDPERAVGGDFGALEDGPTGIIFNRLEALDRAVENPAAARVKNEDISLRRAENIGHSLRLWQSVGVADPGCIHGSVGRRLHDLYSAVKRADPYFALTVFRNGADDGGKVTDKDS